jgi:hypothetical protein
MEFGCRVGFFAESNFRTQSRQARKSTADNDDAVIIAPADGIGGFLDHG